MGFSPASVLFDAAGNPVGVTQDGSIYRLQVETGTGPRIAATVYAIIEFNITVPAGEYLIAIDKDNASSFYKHDGAKDHLLISGANAALIKEKINDLWEILIGVILRVNGTDADVAWFPFGSLFANDTSKSRVETNSAFFPLEANLKITSDELDFVATNFIEANIAAINTGLTIPDAGGNAIAPAAGDIIMRGTRNAGSGTARGIFSITYRSAD